MAVYERGEVWWFKFVWNGELIRASTKQGNKRVAEQIEASRKAAREAISRSRNSSPRRVLLLPYHGMR
jgi:hypothetical protein